ncbi:ATP-dependent Clp protease ATP-binding subunit ClpX [Blattabacterium cuenoti]|uniref:ATP-dependent Clp protease ATP-binding subunit ClpX n=1 Tax=Blattabacterium cuenoti TaxID=1653831 RepID=UPI00163C238A|nr:ATP-dependent Clp protease ATP-binding subunit ClpX [Blattabacterium cuenoti]
MKDLLKCNFCGKNKNNINLLISGINSYICDYCVKKTYSIINSNKNNNELYETCNNTKNLKIKDYKNKIKVKKPKEIKSFLDKYIIGHEITKKILSVAVYNHYKRIYNNNNNLFTNQKKEKEKENIQIDKSNILLIGDTGTGKTLLAKSIAKLMNVPFSISDSTSLTEAGYVGEDVESILTRLLQSADYHINFAEKGIIFIDEIDKISRKSANPSITRDVSGEGVQQALLKILEGSIVHVPPQGGRKHPEQKMIPINTENILFIAGGTFDGINKIISERKHSSTIGYFYKKKQYRDNLKEEIQYEDLKKFGLIPELIGRFPIVNYLNPLDKILLKRILVEPKNSLIKQYKRLFYLDKISLNITDDALDIIVNESFYLGLGARGLRIFCEKIFLDYLFDIENTNTILNIDKNIVEQKLFHS